MKCPSPAAVTPGRSPALPDPRPLWRVFLVFLGPMVLANILQSLSGTLNNVFVGQLLGTQALPPCRPCSRSSSSSFRW
jgi:Na+-driven multidrug efflux pump